MRPFVFPTIMPFGPWLAEHPFPLPKLYWGAISQEQRIAEICRKVAGIEGYLAYLSRLLADLPEELRRLVEEEIAGIRAEFTLALEELRASTDVQLQELRDWIASIEASMSVYDVTRGLYDESQETMRRTYRDVTFWGTTVDELAQSTRYETVTALAQCGYNVRALSVLGAIILGTTSDPSPWQPARYRNIIMPDGTPGAIIDNGYRIPVMTWPGEEE